ncbi:MAG: hypothetical protein ACI81L_000459 [Verrucomicrobiales bacterium]|jgi:hypothetical protein
MLTRTTKAGRVWVVIAVFAAAIAVPVTSGDSADAAGWQGFAVSDLPSGIGFNDSPAWGLGITEDLGGPGVDVWNNNHGSMSEAIIDLSSGTSTRTAFQSGDPEDQGPDTHGVAFSDIDGDGDEDLLEVSGRNNNNRLFRNDGGTLQFVDAGALKDIFGRGRQPLFFDYDNDGDMDVLITNLDLRSDPVPQGERQLKPSEVYLNNGDGTTWSKVPDPGQIITDAHVRIAQLTSTGPATSNIIVTHDVFTLAKDSMAVGGGSMAEPSNPAIQRRDETLPIREVLVGDFDGDLHPEFIVFNGSESNSAGNWPVTAHEVTAAGNGRTVSLPMSADLDNCRSGAAADFDNDGDLDILAGCTQRQEGQLRNVLLLNDGEGNFSDGGTGVLPATTATAPAQTAGAIVVADINADGWMDAIIGNGYDFDRAVDHVLTNKKGSGNHWLEIDLVGSNPDAMGAQLFVGASDWQVRETGHRYHRSQDGRTLHVGLGPSTEVAPVEIRWPDGSYSTCTVPGIDRRVQIVKGSAACKEQTKAGLLAALAAAPNTSPGSRTCAGIPVTVDFAKGQLPTNGDDVIIGTSTANFIDALAGDDLICGLQGNDIILGGAGRDQIYAGAGNDEIRGGPDADRIRGGAGNDVITGGEGWDWLFGNSGRDQIGGGNGVDHIRGGLGIDRLDGGPMKDFCAGGQKVSCERRF